MPRTRAELRIEPLEDRLAPAAGDLDPTFGTGGIVTTAVTIGVSQLVVLPDGRSVVVGFPQDTPLIPDDPRVVAERYNADGTFDPTYSGGGTLDIPVVQPTAIAAQPDGRVLVVGTTTRDDQTSPNLILRLTTDGQFDPTFGDGGRVVFDFDTLGAFNAVNAIAVAPDGRIVVAGSVDGLIPRNPITDRFDTGTGGAMAVARLTADGRPDTTFDGDGFALASVPVGKFDDAAARAVAVQPDGFIILAGDATAAVRDNSTRGFPSFIPLSDLAAVRLRPDGQLDPTFGDGGRARAGLNPSNRTTFQVVEVRPDGGIILGGVVDGNDGSPSGPSSRFGAGVRLTADGKLDPQYGTGGIAIDDVERGEFTCAIGPDGEVVFIGAGESLFGNSVSRLTPDGRVDTRFGTNGVVETEKIPLVSGTSAPIAVDVQPDGNILLGGTRQSDDLLAPQTGAIVRLLGNGPPPGFVPSTRGTIQIGGPTDGSVAVLRPDASGLYITAEVDPPLPTMAVWPGATENVRVATADVNGDGTSDYIDGRGPGSVPIVTVFDGATGNVLAEFLAFERSFTGGVFVAGGDINGDGRAEIVVTPDQGGGPNVVIFALNTDGSLAAPRAFFALGNPSFRGGARPAVGDVNADGTPDLAVGAGFLGGPVVEIHDGAAVAAGNFGALIGTGFFAFDGPDAVTLRNGVYLAIGDLNGDGFGDLIFGGGPGGGPRVLTLDGRLLAAGDVAGAYAAPLTNFFAGADTDRGGVRVASTDADGDAQADLVLGSGDEGTVTVCLGKDFTSTDEPDQVQSLGPFGPTPVPDGVFVG